MLPPKYNSLPPLLEPKNRTRDGGESGRMGWPISASVLEHTNNSVVDHGFGLTFLFWARIWKDKYDPKSKDSA